MYIAYGQDVAQIVEGSQAIVEAESTEKGLSIDSNNATNIRLNYLGNKFGFDTSKFSDNCIDFNKAVNRNKLSSPANATEHITSANARRVIPL